MATAVQAVKRERREGTAVKHTIMPTAVYSLEAVRRCLGLAKNTLAREVRLGRLRMSKRSGRAFFLGAWLLEWIEGGEVKRRGTAQDGEE